MPTNKPDPERLHWLYIDEQLTISEVGATQGVAFQAVHNRLAVAQIPGGPAHTWSTATPADRTSRRAIAHRTPSISRRPSRSRSTRSGADGSSAGSSTNTTAPPDRPAGQLHEPRAAGRHPERLRRARSLTPRCVNNHPGHRRVAIRARSSFRPLHPPASTKPPLNLFPSTGSGRAASSRSHQRIPARRLIGGATRPPAGSFNLPRRAPTPTPTTISNTHRPPDRVSGSYTLVRP
jgi:hypothetical protein